MPSLPTLIIRKGAVAKSASAPAKSAAPRAARKTDDQLGKAELERQVKAAVAKAVDAAMGQETREGAEKIEALEKQAADWRHKALEGRVSGLDVEVRELYVRKAEAAEKAAQQLRDGAADDVNVTAAGLEAAADEYREKALKAETPEARRYWFDKQREYLARAAIARGEHRR